MLCSASDLLIVLKSKQSWPWLHCLASHTCHTQREYQDHPWWMYPMALSGNQRVIT